MIVLGIETSCDETAAALVERKADGTGRILAHAVRSQIDEHAPYGGVVPEIAARAHVEILDGLVRRVLAQAGLKLSETDAIAATAGPGLVGGLLVGLTEAKMLALAAGKPFLPINHLEGHALTARLTDNVQFPYLLLLVSGGHTQIVLVSGLGRYHRLGTTIDDALGECFDKTAKLLGLPYPGGPAVERAAQSGRAGRVKLPRPLLGAPGCDFSFSGLKTAVRHAARQLAEENAAQGGEGLSAQDKADICASFQAAIADIVADRLDHAFAQAEEMENGLAGGKARLLVAAGGVAANAALRARLEELCAARGFAFVAPPLEFCSDNAAMIAWAGAEHFAARAAAVSDNMDFAPRARWPLDSAAPAKIGSGRKGAKA